MCLLRGFRQQNKVISFFPSSDEVGEGEFDASESASVVRGGVGWGRNGSPGDLASEQKRGEACDL